MKNAAVQRTISVAKSFDEKAPQLSVDAITAFGIALTTRYGKCGEMVDMLNFAKEAAVAGVASCVQSLFYDSKSGVCAFELHVGIDPEAEELLRGIAKMTISQFMWPDGIIDGYSLDD